MAEARALGGDEVVRVVDDVWGSRMDRVEATFTRVVDKAAKIDKQMAVMCEFFRSFSRNERCDVSALIARMESIDSVAETDSEAQVELVSASAIHIRDEGDSTTKMESNDSMVDIVSNPEVESLEIASVLEKDCGNTYKMLQQDSGNIELQENEVPISVLESCHKVDELRWLLLKNRRSQPLSDDSRYDQVGSVLSVPKVEQAYILDMDVKENLIQKSVEAIDFVTHKVFDQMCLRGRRENQQKIMCKMLKTWNFKFKRKELTGTRPQFDHINLVESVISKTTWEHWRVENVMMGNGLSGLSLCIKVWEPGGLLPKLAEWKRLGICHVHGWIMRKKFRSLVCYDVVQKLHYTLTQQQNLNHFSAPKVFEEDKPRVISNCYEGAEDYQRSLAANKKNQACTNAKTEEFWTTLEGGSGENVHKCMSSWTTPKGYHVPGQAYERLKKAMRRIDAGQPIFPKREVLQADHRHLHLLLEQRAIILGYRSRLDRLHYDIWEKRFSKNWMFKFKDSLLTV